MARYLAAACALAAGDAHALAADLERRSEKLLALAPKLRAKGAARVIELLLADDAVSPARAEKIAGLSDRAARRLFDRLVELGAVRELGPVQFSHLRFVRARMARPHKRERADRFDAELDDCPKACAGGNGWAASRRRFLPPPVP